MKKSEKKRMVFGKEMSDFIMEQLAAQNVHPGTTQRALQQWNDGNEARNPLESACFNVFRQIQTDFEKRA